MARVEGDSTGPGRSEAPSSATAIGWLIQFVAAPGRALEFVRYTGASGVALVLDTTIFLALVAQANLPAPIAAAVGYLAGVALHYALSVRYIFAADKTGKTHRRLMTEFLGTGLLGLILTVLIIRLTVDVVGLPPLLGKILSSVVAFLAVYVARAGGVLAAAAESAEATGLGAQHSRSQ